MNAYIGKLGLDYDPFDDGFSGDDFFGAGGREALVYSMLDSERGQVSLDAVIGPRGSGKTRLARRLCERARSDFKPALVSVGLFTTAENLLRGVLLKLDIDPPGDLGRDLGRGLESLSECAVELARAGKSILLVIDDAQELGSDCMKLVEKLLANRWSETRLILLGGEQLVEMLQTRLRERYRARLALHELAPLNRVEIAEYIHLKLARAGYKEKLSLSSQAGLDVLQKSAGVPGKINMLTAEMLDSDAVPAAGSPFGRRLKRKAAGARPEFRYLRHAFVLSLALAAVVFWPVNESESPGALDAASEPQRVSLAVPLRPGLAADRAPGQAGENPAQAGMPAPSPTEAGSAAETSGLSEFEQMLLGAPADNFTVQVLASSSEEGVRGFIAATQFGEIHGYYETRREGAPWFVVVEGVYSDWETARDARTRLAGKFDDLEPWIRRINIVHSEIGRAGKRESPGP